MLTAEVTAFGLYSYYSFKQFFTVKRFLEMFKSKFVNSFV